MYYKSEPVASTTADTSPNRGPSTDPNPGERSAQDEAMGIPKNSLGPIPARGNKAGGGQEIDTGARVGILRNLEFTAGGRAHRLSVGSFSNARPAYDPKSGYLAISSISDAGSPTIGPASGNEGHTATVPPKDSTEKRAGDTNDRSKGDEGPSRRRDTKTV